MSINESIVEDAVLTGFDKLGDATHDWSDVFGLPPRISKGCSPN